MQQPPREVVRNGVGILRTALHPLLPGTLNQDYPRPLPKAKGSTRGEVLTCCAFLYQTEEGVHYTYTRPNGARPLSPTYHACTPRLGRSGSGWFGFATVCMG